MEIARTPARVKGVSKGLYAKAVPALKIRVTHSDVGMVRCVLRGDVFRMNARESYAPDKINSALAVFAIGVVPV
jgi:hypothetical protein